MFLNTVSGKAVLVSFALLVYSSFNLSFGQEVVSPGQNPPDEVLRINTNLMQVQAVVLDKQGRFVDNLGPDQFQLTVNGKPVAVSFFELVIAGSPNEETQLATGRGIPLPAENKRLARTEYRGRTIFFVIDDLHLAHEGLVRTRQTLLRFIDDAMETSDQVAILTPSGQIGFLQQLTNNKAVLRAAVARLTTRSASIRDLEQPPMSPYQAQAIERNSREVLGYFKDELQKRLPGIMPDATESMVRARAQRVSQQSNAIANNTLSTLANLVRSATPLPGRKRVFFLSDGFPIDNNQSDVLNWLRLVTDGAARSNIVIYTADTRGLTSGMVDVTSHQGFDRTNRLSVADPMAELRAAQEPLHTLAADTGGRSLVNTNAWGEEINKVLRETSRYYILAWQTNQTGQAGEKYHRIKVALKDRPELKVLTNGGLFTAPPQPSPEKRSVAEGESAAVVTSDRGLLSAINSRYPIKSLPTFVTANYLDSPQQGIVLISNMEVETDALSYGAGGEKQNAEVQIMGVVFDDKGKIVSSFKELLSVAPPATADKMGERYRSGYNHQCRLEPGLYLVKVASRDKKSGKSGNAAQWVEISDLKQGRFTLGSLFIQEQAASDAPAASNATPSPAPDDPLLPVVDGRLAQTSTLRLQTIIYNTQASASAPPDVAVQIEIQRQGRTILTTPMSKVEVEGVKDLKRIPYGAAVSLKKFPAGQYTLKVVAVDRATNTSSSQQVAFAVEKF